MTEGKDRNPEPETLSPVRHVDDRGPTSAEKADAGDEQPASALGGHTATRSGTSKQPNPAEQRSE